MTEPRGDRPHIPGYGIPTTLRAPCHGRGRSSDSRAPRSTGSATTGADAAPHLIPIWGSWTGGRWYVEGGPTRWQRNLRENPQLAIKVESGDEVVIVEGTARELVAPAEPLSSAILAGYAKYKAAGRLRGEPLELGPGRPVGAHPGQGVRLVRLPDGHDPLPIPDGVAARAPWRRDSGRQSRSGEPPCRGRSVATVSRGCRPQQAEPGLGLIARVADALSR